MALRLNECAVILLCVSSVVLGAYLAFLALDEGNLSTSPLTAAGIAFIGTGVLGTVFEWRIAVVRSSKTASICIAICVALTIVVISLVTHYAWNLGFGAA